MDLSVELHCEACGSAHYSVAGAGDSARVRCNDCGADLGTVAALRDALLDLALGQSAEALRRDLGKMKGAADTTH